MTVPLLGTLALVLLMLVVGASFDGLRSVQRSNDHASNLERAVRVHQDGDMMHDALRGDVLNAFLVGRTGRGDDVDTKADVLRDVNADAARFRADIRTLATLRLARGEGASLRRAEPALIDYADYAVVVVNLAVTDRAAALLRLPVFDLLFQTVAITEANITTQLSAAARGARAGTAEAQRSARRGLLFAAGLGLLVVTGAAVVLERLRVSSRRSLRALRQARRQAVADREFLAAVLESLDDGIVACDAEGTLTLFNRATERLHGLPMHGLAPEQWAEYYDLYRADGKTPLTIDEIPLFRALNGEPVDGVEMVIAPRDRAARLVQTTGRAIVDDRGTKLGAVVAMHDVTDRRAAEERLVHQALQDTLTGLPNRVLLADRLAQADARADRTLVRVWLLVLDLDGFKSINDSLGHGAGDEVLVAVAGRLRRSVRPSDTVARLGGDEFAVLVESSEDPEEIAGRLLRVVRSPIELSTGPVRLTASIGLASAGIDGVEVGGLLQAADVAMYVAKAQGRDRYEVFVPAMQAAVERRHVLSAELRDGVEQGDLSVRYQPQVDLASGVVVGVEALVRWQHPVRGLISPDEFIPLAEETGQIIDIDDWVLRTACSQAAEWSRCGHPLRLAVNLSGRHFQHPGVVGRINAAFTETGYDPRLLELEVTETAAVHEAHAATSALEQLRSIGVTIAIDDFGTGYSVLSRLRDFPLDTLKIDLSFVREIINDTDHAPLVAGKKR